MPTCLERSEPEPDIAAVPVATRALDRSDQGAADRRAHPAGNRQPTAARRLLVVSSHFPPERAAGVHRVLRIVRQLRAVSWPVSVLTVSPEDHRAGTPVDQGLLDRLPDGVQVHRTKALRYLTALAHGRNRLRRAVRDQVGRLFGRVTTPTREGSAAATVAKTAAPEKQPFIDAEIGWFLPAIRQGRAIIAREKPDVIFSTAPPFTCHLIAGWLARRHHIRWVADFRDPWARSPWGGPNFARSFRGRLRRRLERLVIERADAVVLNTPPLCDDFVKHYGPSLAHKFHAVTNGYDADVLAPYLRRTPGRRSRLVLTHAGSLYRRRDPRPLLEGVASAIASKRIAADDLELHFVGSISPEFAMAETLRRLNLESVVRLTPPVAHEVSLEHLSQADVLVVIQPDTGLQVPVKLYEYLPFEKPILALAPPGALGAIVEKSGLGLLANPDDLRAIEDAVCELCHHRHRLADRFPPNSSYIEQFDGDVVSRQLQRILEAS